MILNNMLTSEEEKKNNEEYFRTFRNVLYRTLNLNRGNHLLNAANTYIQLKFRV